MRPRFRQRPTGVQYHETYVEINGVEHNVKVGYYIQREESDTGTPSGINVDSVTYSLDGKNAWDDVTEDQQNQFAIEIGEYGDEADYGDYLYEQMKDARMERE